MMWWGQGFSWGWMLFGGLMMILFWGGLIALIVLAVRGLTGVGSSTVTPAPASASNSALRILQERYARGEITKEEYEDMRRDLET
ncbi:MAG TPA: SHOCT domain-containing protein [Anaerolineae bacterium]|nr:SHOCT domain-containing protein [Anaerolineae bacterium]HIP73432.1 SHOCT domain-containing protein [Anaerolineae bacterium]